MSLAWLVHVALLTAVPSNLPAAHSGKATATAPAAYMSAGSHAVETLLVEWKDANRDRNVPAKIYYPADGDGPFPVIIFSHGLGGTREGYEYLGRQWASHGYVSVHVQHEGSDDSVWRKQANPAEQMARAAKDPRNILNRPRDISFAIDEVTKLQTDKDSPLKGKLNLEAIGVGGHSFGAFTALAVAGEGGNRIAAGKLFTDPRVKAAIAMSAPVPSFRKSYDGVYDAIRIPVMHMTGTADETTIADTKAADRRIPYDHIDKADQYLITFVGGDHMIFSGRPRRGKTSEKDAAFQDLIRMDTTAFWDAYLKQDAKAKAWLQDGGLAEAMAANAKVELKPGKEQAAAGRTDSTARRPRLGGGSRGR